MPVAPGMETGAVMREYLRSKFVLAFSTLASPHVPVWNAKIGDGVYSAVVAATVAAFIAGEAFEKAKP